MSSKVSSLEIHGAHYDWEQSHNFEFPNQYCLNRKDEIIIEEVYDEEQSLPRAGNGFKYSNQRITLYKAAMNGSWKVAEEILDINPELVRMMISHRQEMALHVALAAGNKNFVQNLLEKMEARDLALKNIDGDTALCVVAASNDVEIAEALVLMDPRLPMIPGDNGVLPLYKAAQFGRRKMVIYLYKNTDYGSITSHERTELFHTVISTDIYEVALDMLEKDMSLATSRNKDNETALHLLARKRAMSGRISIIYERWINPGLKKDKLLATRDRTNELTPQGFRWIFRDALRQTLARKLVKQLWDLVLAKPEEEIWNLVRKPGLLFEAAAVGNVEFLLTLIRAYPSLLWEVDEENRSIFHIAVLNRQENIFSLIYDLGPIKNFITAYKEPKTENTILHLAAICPPQYSRTAKTIFQVQKEVSWFKAVQKIVPTSYNQAKNKEGKLPQDLFDETHQNLRDSGEKWTIKVAQLSMIASTLIATVASAAALTVPGGNDDKTGFARLRKDEAYGAFMSNDVIAMSTSMASIAIFLSIYTSRYAYEDFCSPLGRLVLGVLMSYLSMMYTARTFATALLLIYDKASSDIGNETNGLTMALLLVLLYFYLSLWLKTGMSIIPIRWSLLRRYRLRPISV